MALKSKMVSKPIGYRSGGTREQRHDPSSTHYVGDVSPGSVGGEEREAEGWKQDPVTKEYTVPPREKLVERKAEEVVRPPVPPRVEPRVPPTREVVTREPVPGVPPGMIRAVEPYAPIYTRRERLKAFMAGLPGVRRITKAPPSLEVTRVPAERKAERAFEIATAPVFWPYTVTKFAISPYVTRLRRKEAVVGLRPMERAKLVGLELAPAAAVPAVGLAKPAVARAVARVRPIRMETVAYVKEVARIKVGKAEKAIAETLGVTRAKPFMKPMVEVPTRARVEAIMRPKKPAVVKVRGVTVSPEGEIVPVRARAVVEEYPFKKERRVRTVYEAVVGKEKPIVGEEVGVRVRKKEERALYKMWGRGIPARFRTKALVYVKGIRENAVDVGETLGLRLKKVTRPAPPTPPITPIEVAAKKVVRVGLVKEAALVRPIGKPPIVAPVFKEPAVVRVKPVVKPAPTIVIPKERRISVMKTFVRSKVVTKPKVRHPIVKARPVSMVMPKPIVKPKVTPIVKPIVKEVPIVKEEIMPRVKPRVPTVGLGVPPVAPRVAFVPRMPFFPPFKFPMIPPGGLTIPKVSVGIRPRVKPVYAPTLIGMFAPPVVAKVPAAEKVWAGLEIRPRIIPRKKVKRKKKKRR